MKTDTRKLVRLALLTALVLLMAYTPIGYLKIGPVEITFLMVPVIIGAIILGPGAGAFLGLVFGITSFLTGVTGSSFFGATLLSINPVLFFILCVPTRVLAGFIPGLVFKLMSRKKPNIAAFVLSSLSGALANTVFFVGFLMLVFGNTDYIRSFGSSTWAIIWVIVGVNGLVEAAACTLLGTAIGKVLHRFLPNGKKA